MVHVLKENASKKHPFSTFDIGNNDTLKNDLIKNNKNIITELKKSDKYFSLKKSFYILNLPCTVNVIVYCKCDCKCNVLLLDMATLYTLSRLTLPPMAGPVSIPHVSVMRGSLEHSYLE